MAVKTITFGLGEASLNRAIRELKEYEEEVKRNVAELVKRLTETGVTVAITRIAMLGAVDTGELSDSIDGYYSAETQTGFIRANAYYAFFVEYGTGIRGTKHPGDEEWAPPPVSVTVNGKAYGPYTQHDTNGHGEGGWYYISERDGKRHWTKGMPSRPFMYETYKELEGMCERIYQEVFNG